jgi:hypothetical protein
MAVSNIAILTYLFSGRRGYWHVLPVALRREEAQQVFMAVSNTEMLTYVSSRRRGCWRILHDHLR